MIVINTQQALIYIYDCFSPATLVFTAERLHTKRKKNIVKVNGKINAEADLARERERE